MFIHTAEKLDNPRFYCRKCLDSFGLVCCDVKLSVVVCPQCGDILKLSKDGNELWKFMLYLHKILLRLSMRR